MQELKIISPSSISLNSNMAWASNPIQRALCLLLSKNVIDRHGSFLKTPPYPRIEECGEAFKQALEKTTILLYEKRTLVGRSVKEVAEKHNVKFEKIPEPIVLTFTLEGLLKHLQKSKSVGHLLQSSDIVGGTAIRILKEYFLEVSKALFDEHKVKIEELNPLLLKELNQPANDLDIQIGIIEATLENRELIMNEIIAYLASQISSNFDDNAYLNALKPIKIKYNYISNDSKSIRQFCVQEFVLEGFTTNVVEYNNQFSFARFKDINGKIIDLLAREEKGKTYKRECLYRSNAVRVSCINKKEEWTIAPKMAHGIDIAQIAFDLVMGIQYPPDVELVGPDDLGRVALKSCYGRGLVEDEMTKKIIQAALSAKESIFNRFKNQSSEKNITISTAEYLHLLLKHCWEQHQPDDSAVYYLFNASIFLLHSKALSNAELRHLWAEMLKAKVISLNEKEPFEKFIVQAIVKEAIPFSEISSWMQLQLQCFAPSSLIKWEEKGFAFRFKKLIFPHDLLAACKTIEEKIIPKIENSDPCVGLLLELMKIVLQNQDCLLNYPSEWLQNPLEFAELLKNQDNFKVLAEKLILSPQPYIAYLGAYFLLAIPQDKFPESSIKLLISELPRLMMPLEKKMMLRLLDYFSLAVKDSKDLSRCVNAMSSTLKNLYIKKADSFHLCWIENLAESQETPLVQAASRQFIARGQFADDADVALGLKIVLGLLQEPKNGLRDALEIVSKLTLIPQQLEECFLMIEKATRGSLPEHQLILLAEKVAKKSPSHTCKNPQIRSSAFANLIQTLHTSNATKAEELLLLCCKNKLLFDQDLMEIWLVKLESLKGDENQPALMLLEAQKLNIFRVSNDYPLTQDRLTKLQTLALEKLKKADSNLLGEPLFLDQLVQQTLSLDLREAEKTVAFLLTNEFPSTIPVLKAALKLLISKEIVNLTLWKQLFQKIPIRGDKELKEECGKLVQDRQGNLIKTNGFVKFDDESLIYILKSLASIQHPSLLRFIIDDTSFQRFWATFHKEASAFNAFEVVFTACIPLLENDSLREALYLRCHTLQDWGWKGCKDIDISIIRHWISSSSPLVRSFAAERLEALIKEQGFQKEWIDLLEPSFYLPYLKYDHPQSITRLKTESHVQSCKPLLKLITNPEKLFEYQLLLGMDVKDCTLAEGKQHKAFVRCHETLLKLNNPISVYWATELLIKAPTLLPTIDTKHLETIFEKTLSAANQYPDFYIEIQDAMHVASALMNLSEVNFITDRIHDLREKHLRVILSHLDLQAKKTKGDWRLFRYESAYIKLAIKLAHATTSQEIYHKRALGLLPLYAKLLVHQQHPAIIDHFFELYSDFKGTKKFKEEQVLQREALEALLKVIWKSGEEALNDTPLVKSQKDTFKAELKERLLKYQTQICNNAYYKWGITYTVKQPFSNKFGM